jgi:hypothetical protein
MNGLIRKLVMSMGMKWLTAQVRAVAEGKHGPRWQALYWKTAGLKRATGLLLDVAAGAAALLDQPVAATALGSAGTFLIALGFVDANWRDMSDSDWLKDSAVWKFLAHNSPTITAGLTAATVWLQGTSCTLGEHCALAASATMLLGAMLVQIGVCDAAWNAIAPKVPLP